MTAPIYDFLNRLNKTDSYPFHMPGHKRRPLFDLPSFSFDITEINGADNLHKPEGIIKEAQDLMAELTGAKRSFFCVNGSSGAIMAAIMSLCEENDKILVARNCHRSVYNGILLSGALPVCVYPHITDGLLQGGINPCDVEKALNQNPDIKAMIMTSPTYEGFCSDIAGISDILHSHGIPLIVDEAHGAHFGLSPYFPQSSITLGGDIVIQSWHKTLPVLTQCSVVHIGSDLVDGDRLFTFLSMLQTSSPSYLFMASLDKCREIIENDGDRLFYNFSKRLDGIRDALSENKALRLIGSEIKGKHFISDFDKSRLVFEINCNINGNILENMLIKDYNLQIEMCGLKHIVLIAALTDTDDGFMLLKKAAESLENKLEYKKTKPAAFTPQGIAMAHITPKQAFYSNKRQIGVKSAAGMTAADFVTPYPPGIPVLVPGEVISREAADEITRLNNAGIPILGIDGDMRLTVCV